MSSSSGTTLSVPHRRREGSRSRCAVRHHDHQLDRRQARRATRRVARACRTTCRRTSSRRRRRGPAARSDRSDRAPRRCRSRASSTRRWRRSTRWRASRRWSRARWAAAPRRDRRPPPRARAARRRRFAASLRSSPQVSARRKPDSPRNTIATSSDAAAPTVEQVLGEVEAGVGKPARGRRLAPRIARHAVAAGQHHRSAPARDHAAVVPDLAPEQVAPLDREPVERAVVVEAPARALLHPRPEAGELGGGHAVGRGGPQQLGAWLHTVVERSRVRC